MFINKHMSDRSAIVIELGYVWLAWGVLRKDCVCEQHAGLALEICKSHIGKIFCASCTDDINN